MFKGYAIKIQKPVLKCTVLLRKMVKHDIWCRGPHLQYHSPSRDEIFLTKSDTCIIIFIYLAVDINFRIYIYNSWPCVSVRVIRTLKHHKLVKYLSSDGVMVSTIAMMLVRSPHSSMMSSK